MGVEEECFHLKRPQDLNQRRPLDHPDQSLFRKSVNIAMHRTAAALLLCNYYYMMPGFSV